MDIQEIVIAVLVIIFGGSGIVSIFLRSKIEELREVQRSIREEQRKIYYQILIPYAKLFTSLGNEKKLNEVVEHIKSEEYRKTLFDFNLIGSDNVVNAYNEMMQHTYKSETSGYKDPKEMMRLWGNLLLEIRKDLGNRKTKLDEVDMLKGMIKDIDKYLKK